MSGALHRFSLAMGFPWLLCKLRSFPGGIQNWPLHGGQGETEEGQASAEWQVAVLRSKRANVLRRPASGSCQMSPSPHLLPGSESICRGLNGVRSSMPWPSGWSQQHTLPHSCVLEVPPTVGTVGGTYISRSRERAGASHCPGHTLGIGLCLQ